MKKTLIVAACIGIASIASAQKGTGGPSAQVVPGNGNFSGNSGLAATVTSSNYDPQNGSTTLVVDISGTESWDAQLDPSNTVLNVAVPGSEVSAIGWDVNLSTVGASWLSEAVMDFQGDVFLTVGVGDDFAGTSAYSSGAPVVLGDVGIPNIVIAGGTLPIEFFESFDDVADAVDAVFTGPSELTLVYEGGAAVPTVSQWGLIILTAMLLLGVVMMSLKSRNQTVTA